MYFILFGMKQMSGTAKTMTTRENRKKTSPHPEVSKHMMVEDITPARSSKDKGPLVRDLKKKSVPGDNDDGKLSANPPAENKEETILGQMRSSKRTLATNSDQEADAALALARAQADAEPSKKSSPPQQKVKSQVTKEAESKVDASASSKSQPRVQSKSAPSNKGGAHVIQLSNLEEYKKFKEENLRGVVFYGADWCHLCKGIEPLYTRIANRYHNRVAMAYVDIDVANLKFSAVPVFTAIYKGKEVDSIEGADKEALKTLVKGAINAN